MQIKLRPWKKSESLYFYPQSTQISGMTGLIGRLRADFDSNGKGFYTTWEDKCVNLKTEEFKNEFDNVINALRFKGATPFGDRNALKKYLRDNGLAPLPGNTDWSGFRADTDQYAYLFRLKADPGDYNIYCYCYKREFLDRHILEAEKGIRFITSNYKDKFKIQDGEKIKVDYPSGSSYELTCRYVDPYHFESQPDSTSRTNLWHICEFAERMEENEAVIKPLVQPEDIIETNYYCPLTFTIMERNEYGDIEEDGCEYDGRVALQYEEQIKKLIDKEHSYKGCDDVSMASYQDNPKVLSTRWDVREINGNLFGCIHVKLSDSLTPSEETEFKDWLEGQCSDGFGEGMEQREIDIDEGIGYVSFWKGGDDWCIKNENEFKQQFRKEITMGGM